jgi:hypothetical protein
MRTQDTNTEVKVTTKENVQPAFEARHSYHELAEKPVVEVDLIETLHQNISKISDLQNRLNFVMKEIRYLMKL